MTSNHHQQLIEKASRQAKSLQLDEIQSNLLVKLALLLFDFNDFFLFYSYCNCLEKI